VPTLVSPEDYFGAATDLLSEDGYRGLTMTALHRRLGVSSGSFYNYFRNWDEFVRAFLEHWTVRTNDIADRAAATVDSFERLHLLRALTRTVAHNAEAAIRIWAAMDPAVAAAQRDVDQRRLALIRAAVIEVTGDEERAGRLAESALSMIVGWQQISRPFDADRMDRMLNDFIANLSA
jgi:AcrR family transcriptional regulator